MENTGEGILLKTFLKAFDLEKKEGGSLQCRFSLHRAV